METHSCPCCHKEISFKVFLKQLFVFKKRNPFSDNEKGVLCIHCSKSILCTEQKNKFFIPILLFLMMPFFVAGIVGEALFDLQNGIYFLIYLLLTFIASYLTLLKTYQKTQFICDDASSNKYNNEITHV